MSNRRRRLPKPAAAAHTVRLATPSRRTVAKNQYSAIDRDRKLISKITAEKHGEDWHLRGNRRGLLLALMRDNFRNAPEARTLCEQRALNIIGSVGGRLQITTPDDRFNAAAGEFFRARSAAIEFTNGISLNELLRRILISLDVGGDLVVVADVPDAVTGIAPFCGSGKIRVFDADEIANVQQQWFDAHFPGYVQRDGLIYDMYGRHVGVIVSTSKRGAPTFGPDDCMVLLRDPDSGVTPNWLYMQHAWRPNQGRGVSPFATVSTSLHNIDAISTAETAASRLNAQMVGCYKKPADNASDDEKGTPDEYTPVTVNDDGTVTDETGTVIDGVTAADTAAADAAEPAIFPDHFARANEVYYDVLPDGYEVQQYDTKRPNANVAQFLRYMTGRAASVLGMGLQYVTLDPQASYSAFRGAQVLVRPMLTQMQKFFERTLCDWLAGVLIGHAIAAGQIARPAAAVGESWKRCLFWTWPKQEECNAVDEQNAVRLRLQNGTVSYRELFGPDWKQRLADIAAEAAELKKHGLVHPMMQTVSGAVVPSEPAAEPEPKKE